MSRHETTEPDSRVDTSILGLGLGLVALGLALTLAQLDLIHLEGLASFWPLVVVLFGGWRLATARGRRLRRGGLWIALVGIWLLVNTLQLFGLFWHDSWPLLMVFLALLRIAWPEGDEDRGGGLVLLAVGGWLLLTVTHAFGLQWQTAWPLLLVFVGLSCMVKALLRALPAFLGDRT
jgi:hypothetical protein